MADFDVIYDPAPQLPLVNDRSGIAGRPSIANLRTALAAVNGGASYTAARLNVMTYNDLVHAAKLHGLSVTVNF